MVRSSLPYEPRRRLASGQSLRSHTDLDKEAFPALVL